MKTNMTDKKTTLPSRRNQDWKTVKAEIKRIINKHPYEQNGIK